MPKPFIAILYYLLLVFAGIALLFLASVLQKVSTTSTAEYFYSDFLRNNYSLLAGIIFFLAGLFVGYFLKLNPWLAGIAMVIAMPLVSFYEAAVYKGSHNLIWFELVIYFLFSVPAITGVYIGRYIAKRRKKQEE
ncbi:hypothetical protein ESA94_06335 [Lacibacter luteus]|uniref:Uncharacterized protein n=1 Tax=Lacibacter luteus TaxID=2508719 RepID=A0A4V1M849_9BACT|nr:hypothetical protein [Lacibacter luteus]RXK62612.1 hypothetical protein ESA94_06335 [Lacibacter luteus]